MKTKYRTVTAVTNTHTTGIQRRGVPKTLRHEIGASF